MRECILFIIVAPCENNLSEYDKWDVITMRSELEHVRDTGLERSVRNGLAFQSKLVTRVSLRGCPAARNGKTRLVGTVSGGWPQVADMAITTRKVGSHANAWTTSINDLVCSVKYPQLLGRWHLGSTAIDKSVTNPAGLPVT
jgi:polar amino acid transport system substrate-binding protein